MIKKTILLSIFLLSANTYAEQTPRPLTTDNRIKTVLYSDNNVYPIYGNYGYSTHVRLSSGEKILKVDIGDADGWVITASENSIFIKNIIESSTNMSVVTDKHSYVFSLRTATEQKQLTYQLNFSYPEEKRLQDKMADLQKKSLSENLKDIDPRNINWKYQYAPSAGKELAPTAAFDDGKFTYFKFSDKNSLPAIFSVDENGNESLVNYTKDGEYLVIHRLDKRYHLRLGDRSVAVFNDRTSEV